MKHILSSLKVFKHSYTQDSLEITIHYDYFTSFYVIDVTSNKVGFEKKSWATSNSLLKLLTTVHGYINTNFNIVNSIYINYIHAHITTSKPTICSCKIYTNDSSYGCYLHYDMHSNNFLFGACKTTSGKSRYKEFTTQDYGKAEEAFNYIDNFDINLEKLFIATCEKVLL